jgi:large subunit ribosomal protein L25
MEVSVECQKRPEGSKPGALRRSGLIPAVLYGHKGTESVSLTLPAKTAETLLKKATVNNTLVQVNIPDISWNGKALLREVQSHPWKRSQIYHLSFFSVASQDSLEVTVPLHFLGQAAGIKSGGILDPVITEIQVQCAPGDIPESIDVDVSNLEIGDSLHVSDLILPQGITPMLEPETTIVIVGGYAGGTQEETEEASAST